MHSVSTSSCFIILIILFVNLPRCIPITDDPRDKIDLSCKVWQKTLHVLVHVGHDSFTFHVEGKNSTGKEPKEVIFASLQNGMCNWYPPAQAEGETQAEKTCKVDGNRLTFDLSEEKVFYQTYFVYGSSAGDQTKQCCTDGPPPDGIQSQTDSTVVIVLVIAIFSIIVYFLLMLRDCKYKGSVLNLMKEPIPHLWKDFNRYRLGSKEAKREQPKPKEGDLEEVMIPMGMDMDTALDKLKEIEAELKEKENNIKEIQEELKKMKGDRDKARADLKDRDVELQHEKEKSNLKSDNINSLNKIVAEVDAKNQRIADMNRKLKTLEDTVEPLKKTLEEWKERCSKLALSVYIYTHKEDNAELRKRRVNGEKEKAQVTGTNPTVSSSTPDYGSESDAPEQTAGDEGAACGEGVKKE